MGLECILFTYAVGLAPLVYGLNVMTFGCVYLTSRSQAPIRGIAARLWGLFSVILAVLWFIVLTWAWGKYGRI